MILFDKLASYVLGPPPLPLPRPATLKDPEPPPPPKPSPDVDSGIRMYTAAVDALFSDDYYAERKVRAIILGVPLGHFAHMTRYGPEGRAIAREADDAVDRLTEAVNHAARVIALGEDTWQ